MVSDEGIATERDEVVEALKRLAGEKGAASAFDATAQLSATTESDDVSILERARRLPIDFVVVGRVFAEETPLLVVSIYDKDGESVAGFIRKKGDEPPSEDQREEEQTGITSQTLESTLEVIEEAQKEPIDPDDQWYVQGGAPLGPVVVVNRLTEERFVEEEVYELLGPAEAAKFREWKEEEPAQPTMLTILGVIATGFGVFSAYKTIDIYLFDGNEECAQIENGVDRFECSAVKSLPWLASTMVLGSVGMGLLRFNVPKLTAERHGGHLSASEIDRRLEQNVSPKPTGVDESEESGPAPQESDPEASLQLSLNPGGAGVLFRLEF